MRRFKNVLCVVNPDETGVLVAHTALAKHDENYMPLEVADSLAKQGYKPEQKL